VGVAFEASADPSWARGRWNGHLERNMRLWKFYGEEYLTWSLAKKRVDEL
jgi:hypothetical protein